MTVIWESRRGVSGGATPAQAIARGRKIRGDRFSPWGFPEARYILTCGV
ncbi:hypothetical protein [Phormidium sp. CCY1219]|nr:hypothetical protein [Phormidium sp. CCY1219]MEB3829748.1 hypothetical protein [Phormidium sp. CCY1219]